MLTDVRAEPLATQEGLEVAAVRGRSLFQDAIHRFLLNRAAVTSVVVLVLIVLFTLVGPFFAKWSIEKIDWSIIGKVLTKGAPSLDTGHYFGTDDLGRDLYSRVIQGTQISLVVGILGSAVAVVVGTLYGAIAGYFGGRLDSLMMRFVDILYSIPYLFILIILLLVTSAARSSCCSSASG